MMHWKKLMIVLSISVISCVTTVPQVEVLAPIEIADKSKVKPIAITKVAAKMRRGSVVGKIRQGGFCTPYQDLKWRTGSTVSLSSEDLVDVFREELEANGWPVVGSTDDLFAGYDVSGAEVLVAARIINLQSELCMPMVGWGRFDAKGSMRMGVEWQVYSPARKTLIGTINTFGSMVLDKPSDDAAYELLTGSFSVAVNNLLASNLFMDMVEKSAGLMSKPDNSEGTLIQNKTINYQTLKAAIAAAKKATVTVRTASGHGSGFAIGDGSYVLTNAHVVGEASSVTLVTSGGLSLEAEVTKVSKARDVALIKLNGLRLLPLHIQPKIPDSADTVYAIGSPLKEYLSGSVTNGIVSGTRILDGYEWIQSDAAISGGNSGGPLMDQNGFVVGISTAGFVDAGTQVGLNLFIPIGEALAHVGLRIK